jgi:hypothetical protein
MACVDVETSKAWSEADVCAREKKPLVDKINELTDMLCWLLKHEQVNKWVPLREDIGKWWLNHVKEDMTRQKIEKEKELKQRALAKLTAEEKRVLGL